MAKKTDSNEIEKDIVSLTIADKGFCNRHRISAIVESTENGLSLVGKIITVCGWVKTLRQQGSAVCFVELNDGSSIINLQIVVDSSIPGWSDLCKASAGWSFKFVGTLVKSPSSKQPVELLLKDPAIHFYQCFGSTDAMTYPLAAKKHSKEYLREILHLRPRTYLIGAVSRLRTQMSMATNIFFQTKGFQLIHTPIITSTDCEGAGDMFQVTTLLPEKNNSSEQKSTQIAVDYAKDFFSRPTFLTVSGQLVVENYCCGLGDVYTFGPTFRAERSNTSRHLAEFWMIEPEIAFGDIYDLMQLSEEYLKFCVKWAIKCCKTDLEWFDKNNEKGLLDRLSQIVTKPFHRISYTDAIKELQQHQDKFSSPIEWGDDLASEHERFLTEAIFNGPIIVYNYPKSLKAFYMRQNDDKQTVAAIDVLLPKVGEVIGGSQREERLDKLDEMIKEKQLIISDYDWYRELRMYGTIPHSGFGLGFERLIMVLSGLQNIRDVIPYPRYPSHAEF